MPREFGASGGYWRTAPPYGGQKLSRGALYLMLQNRIYRGEITHKGNAYPGEHQAIVDKALWDQVQAILAENRVDRATGADAKQPSLLAGLAFDETGERLTPSHAVKKGTRYRYYVSRSLIIGTAKDHSKGGGSRPAILRAWSSDGFERFLADEGAMLSAISDAEENGAEQKRLIARGRQISGEFPTLTPDAITIHSPDAPQPYRYQTRARRDQSVSASASRPAPGTVVGTVFGRPGPTSHPGDILKLKVKARLQRVGREMKLVVHNAEDRTAADPGLLRIVARAHDFQERLIQIPI